MCDMYEFFSRVDDGKCDHIRQEEAVYKILHNKKPINTTRIETNYAHCGGGYHHGDRGERGGYGCCGGYGGVYCRGSENNNEG